MTSSNIYKYRNLFETDSENEDDSLLYDDEGISDNEEERIDTEIIPWGFVYPANNGEEQIVNYDRMDGIGDNEFKEILDNVLSNPQLQTLKLIFDGTAISDNSISYLIDKLEQLSNSALSNVYLSMRDVFITDAACNAIKQYLATNDSTPLQGIDVSSNDITGQVINDLLRAAYINLRIENISLENTYINYDTLNLLSSSLQQIKQPRENPLYVNFGQIAVELSYAERIQIEAAKYNITIECICPPGY